MKVVSTLASGVLKTALIAVASTPFFVLASESPVQVESRESAVLPFREPIEEEKQRFGFEHQYQMQLLQQEVMELRGVIEQLKFELQRLKGVQDDRYLELDSRIQQVMQATVREPVAEPSDKVVELEHSLEEDLSEKDQYEAAQVLIRNGQYDQAIVQLEALIRVFPDGQYTPNAYYWLGQVYAAKLSPDFEKARQSLEQVISYFPDHSKVPDAAYALGKVYNTLGDCQRAKELLEGVVENYGGKSAAKLAEKYLRESVNCDA